MPVLTGSFDSYTLGDYSVLNNDCFAGNLVINTDFTQQVSYNAANLNSGDVMSWSYPEIPGPFYEYGYPEVVWGVQDGGAGPGADTHVMQISNINSLVAT